VLEHERTVPGDGRLTPVIEIEVATWLGPSALLLSGRPGWTEGEPLDSVVSDDSGARQAEARAFIFDGEGLVVVTVVGLQQLLATGGTIELRGGDAYTLVDGGSIDAVATGVQTLARQRLAPLDATLRGDVVEFVARTSGSVPVRERSGLCERLFHLREALRERLPASVISETQPLGLHLDRILAVDDRSFYLEGWIHDEDSVVSRVTAVSPEGLRAETFGRAYRYPRPDVASFFAGSDNRTRTKHGFHCFVELDAPSVLSEGWLLEMESIDGVAVEVGGPPVTRDTTTVRDSILRDPLHDRLPDDELMLNHVYPAISRIQARLHGAEIARVLQFGNPPRASEVSIVVPVYKRLDHLEMQLSEFVSDPEIAGADLIYVLDSPDQADEFLDRAAQLTPLYGVPFRVAVLDQNVGFAGANNAGASIASGRLLLLLNSDILPDKPGWLCRMQEFYDSVPHIGALGVKLLYEDDSIQHAGMYFYQPPGSSVWQDAHYFKGMHRSLPAANVARSVPLVSGACLMIDRTLYQQFGGLRGMFVRGDYEDSDLCLQLTESGRENWYLPDVELYHLEGQSYSANAEQASDRYLTNRYNMWVHTHLWHDRIEEIMRERGGGKNASAVSD
jgi:GT2 family glycosyltransferase